ncbi:hypothetical protein HG536_0A08960 [Torulaspora globosa]|uniref:Ataxin-10 homolog n=1 Tax=Torulaspora globosa TaxID=48254 RepID=A0A7G3ZC43_9SACH|nr:uncharacterized protein HG536_0A08960 [Torulaspora globosa]QLL31079.1 hypothetical protein HG536_0A08960 [Torulaspora globosa]
MPSEAVSSVRQLLLTFEATLRTSPTNIDAYNGLLGHLGEIVQISAKDESFRMELASSEELWSRFKVAIGKAREVAGMVMSDQETSFIYVRTLRGLTLLLRNMSACDLPFPRQMKFLDECTVTFLRIAQLNPNIDEMLISYYTITTGFLHNITKDMTAYENMALEPLMRFLEYPTEHLINDQKLSYCYCTLFLNLTASEDFLYAFFRQTSCSKIIHDNILGGVARHHSVILKGLGKVNADEEKYEITSLDAVLLKTFARLAANESFGHYLVQCERENADVFFDVLKCLRLVVTSSERWDKFTLTVLMTWCFPIFERAAQSTVSYLEKKATDEQEAIILHNKLTMTMDIMSTLAQYDHVQKFLLSYGALEILIRLLRALQNNLVRINFYKNPNGTIKGLKTTDGLGSELTDEQLLSKRIDYSNFHIKATNFPECKLLIIEILTTLIHNRRDVQDKVRELGGLELILSNCTIDDNDPFIKERSVICIKFLLKDNAPNQDFVAKLEAKKVVQEEALSTAGYEVRINSSGELKLDTISDDKCDGT